MPIKKLLAAAALAAGLSMGVAAPAMAAPAPAPAPLHITVWNWSTAGARAGETKTTVITYDVAGGRYVTPCRTEAITAADHGSSSLSCGARADLANPTQAQALRSTTVTWVMDSMRP